MMHGDRMSAKDLPIVDKNGNALLFCVKCIEVRPVDIKQAVAVKQGYSLCVEHLNTLS